MGSLLESLRVKFCVNLTAEYAKREFNMSGVMTHIEYICATFACAGYLLYRRTLVAPIMQKSLTNDLLE